MVLVKTALTAARRRDKQNEHGALSMLKFAPGNRQFYKTNPRVPSRLDVVSPERGAFYRTNPKGYPRTWRD
jgi:hypothetical protein